VDRPIALVTGASRGIGRGIAIQLASDGFFVIINYYQNKIAAEEVLRIVKSRGDDGMVQGFDVSVRNDVEGVVKKLTKELGTIEVLVNNAGIMRDQPLIRMRHRDWDEVITTNLTGMYHCTRSVLKTWAGRKKGSRIVNITSVGGERGFPYSANYSASKAGVIGFTKALAQELAPKNITVNAVSPGFTATDGTSHLRLGQFLPQIPLGRIGRPEDVAYVVSFLVSEKAGYITGQVIRVNGGLYM
jgi:3-oxoacyl-[acyl-carrier protein] reductase